MRNILNARPALIQEDANRALVTCASRNLPDRSREFPSVGSSVQIALRGEWVGNFRALGHSPSNLIVERGEKVTKWPKYKTRLILTQPEEGLGTVVGPGTDGEPSDKEPTETAERRRYRVRHRKSRAQSPGDAPLLKSTHNEGMPGNSLVEKEDAESHELEDGAADIVSDGEARDELLATQHALSPLHPGHMSPSLTFGNQGVIILPDRPGEEGLTPDESYAMFCYPAHRTHLAPHLYTDQDAIDHFDASLIPPRVSYQVPQARLAIGKEIAD